MWTRFMDMHSNGYSKEAWENIYIDATTEEEAKVIKKEGSFDYKRYI